MAITSAGRRAVGRHHPVDADDHEAAALASKTPAANGPPVPCRTLRLAKRRPRPRFPAWADDAAGRSSAGAQSGRPAGETQRRCGKSVRPLTGSGCQVGEDRSGDNRTSFAVGCGGVVDARGPDARRRHPRPHAPDLVCVACVDIRGAGRAEREHVASVRRQYPSTFILGNRWACRAPTDRRRRVVRSTGAESLPQVHVPR